MAWNPNEGQTFESYLSENPSFGSFLGPIDIIKDMRTPDYPNIHEDEPVITAPSIFNANAPGPWNDFNPDANITGWNSGADPFNQASNYYSPYDGWNSELDPFNQEENYTYTTTTTPNNSPNTGGVGGGGGSVAPAPQNVTLTPRDLSQRTPSGTMYAPDLSAYNDSSLFNYTGPGGLSEYTYGQGLPYQGADYSIWGTPADMVNPYYTGQFSTQSTGVADGAISLPPIDLPAGVSPTNNNPNVGTSNTNINTIGGVGAGGGRVNQGSEYETGPIYATAEDAMAAGDYWSAYRKDHARWRAENPNADTYGYPGNTELGIRSDAQQLQAMGGGRNLSEAQINQIRDDEHRMQQGQLGNIPEGLLDVPMNSGLEWIDTGNNPYWLGDEYNPWEGGEFEAQKNFLRPAVSEDELKRIRTFKDIPDTFSLWDNDYDLGRPGDPSYEEFQPTFKPTTDSYPLLQAKADQMMAQLTKEELRDGLFIQPEFKRVDGKVVGRMGIPDIFTQDKSPIEPRSTLFDDPFGEFDPDNRYAEQDIGDGFLWQDKFGEYHKQWDDMGLESYIPGSYDEDFMSGKTMTEAQSLFDNAQNIENAKAAEATRLRDIKARADIEKEIKDQMAARDAVLAAQAAAQAQAEAQAQAQAQAAAQAQIQAAAQEYAQAAAEEQEQAYQEAAYSPPVYTPPVYTPPTQSNMGTGSNWKPSWTGGF